MSFQSASYFLFVGLVWFLSSALRSPIARQVALLGASYAFYSMWDRSFLFLLVGSSLVNYAWGRWLRRSPRTDLLCAGLAANLLVLGAFKYSGRLLGTAGIANAPLQNLVVPIGLSFYTFQGMSYLLDVYRGAADPEPSLIEFLLYMAFWPTILSGPICRCAEMVSQFRRFPAPAFDDVAVGAPRLLYGLFMKAVLAGALGTELAAIAGRGAGFSYSARAWTGIDVWALAVGFGFQIFFDFAGYSHIVIGSARLFGIRLRENFHDPYLSRTPTEFWTRWHMSLSSWIRDYLFFPLAAVRRAFWWRNIALIISMVVFGLWHGPAWTFLAWGVYQGCLLVAHRFIQRARIPTGAGWHSPVMRALTAVISWAATFALVSLGWILFHAGGLHEAAAMLRAVISPANYFRLTLPSSFYAVVLSTGGGYFAYVGARTLMMRLFGTDHLSPFVATASADGPHRQATATLGRSGASMGLR